MNNSSAEVEFPRKFDPAHIVLSCTFVVLIILLAIFGNLLVILSFKKFRRIRQVTNYFVVSLAVTDILVSVISMPVWLAFIADPPLFHTRPLLHMLWTMTDIMVSVASIWHLTFVSIDRYLCITEPLHYHRRMTSTRAVTIVSAIWLYSILAAILGPMSWNWDSYTLVVTVLNYGIPVVIIVFAYVNIFRVAQYQAKQIDLNINGKARRFSLVTEIKAAKTLGVVIGAFIVCWSPFFALNLSYYICHCAPAPVAVSVAKWMHYGNSMLNPLIYGLMNKDFRYSFNKLLSAYLSFLRRDLAPRSDPSIAGRRAEPSMAAGDMPLTTIL